MSKPKLLERKSSLRDRYYVGFASTILVELISVGTFVAILVLRKSFWELQSIAGLFHWNGIGILSWCIVVAGTFYLSVSCSINTVWYILDRPYLKNKACPKMRGEFIRFKKNTDPESGTQLNTLAIVRALDTGKEICLTVEEQDALVPGICYEFLYFPHTKNAYTVGALDEREEDAVDTPSAPENTLRASHTDAEENTEVKKAKLRKRYFTGLVLTIVLDIIAFPWLIPCLNPDSFDIIPGGNISIGLFVWFIVFSFVLCTAGGLTISLVQYILDWKKLKSGSFSTLRGQFIGCRICWSLERGLGVITRRAFVECPRINGVEFRLAVSGENLIPGAFYEFRYLPNTEIAYMVRRYYENEDA